jgi:hypothetical protein
MFIKHQTIVFNPCLNPAAIRDFSF